MKKNQALFALSVLSITMTIEPGTKKGAKKEQTLAQESGSAKDSREQSTAPIIQVQAPDEATPPMHQLHHSPRTIAGQPSINSTIIHVAQQPTPEHTQSASTISNSSDDDAAEEHGHSSARFLPEQRQTASAKTPMIHQALAEVPGFDTCELNLSPEQEDSVRRAVVSYLQKIGQGLQRAALAFDLRTNLEHLGSTRDPQLLATKIGAENEKKAGNGTTIAMNACREAIKSNDTNALKSLLEALKLLGLEQEIGKTDRDAIQRYFTNVAKRLSEDFTDEMLERAYAIRDAATMERMVSGRTTPPARDKDITDVAEKMKRDLMSVASNNRF